MLNSEISAIMNCFSKVLAYILAFLILILIVLFLYVCITDSPISAMEAVVDPFKALNEIE